MTKGTLEKIGTGVYTLLVSDISAPGLIKVSVAKNGYTIVSPGHTVTIPDIQLLSVTANGDPTVGPSTNQLTLTFSQDVPDLEVGDINFNNISVNATSYNTTTHEATLSPAISKGTLTKVAGQTGVYTLGITGTIYIGGTVEVSVTKAGVDTLAQRVLVHRYLNGSLVLRATSSDGSRTTVPGPVFKKPIHTLGAWQWWDSTIDGTLSGTTVNSLYSRMKFWELNGVTEIYYKCDSDLFTGSVSGGVVARDVALKAFTTVAYKYGIKVYVAMNKNDFINDGNSSTAPGSLTFSKFNTFMTAYKNYQDNALPENKFAGIQFNLQYEETTPNKATKDQFIKFFEYVKDTYRNDIEDISAVAAYWWNTTMVTHRGSNKILPEALASEVDRILVISFSRLVSGGAVGSGSIIEMVKPWYTERGDAKVLYCAATDVGTGYWGGNGNGLGKTAMYTALAQVPAVTGSAGFTPALTDENSGIAIDAIDTWMNLKS